jgi:dTDP-4-amino-4,6-dideoxygalactose transaminase
VITSDLTFAASVNPIVQVGATPVLVDVDRATLNLNISQVADRLSPTTKVIMPVHFAGLAASMDPLIEMASDRGIWLIEDAAHAIGATYRGRAVGTFGDVTCFSFQSIKNLTCGEGGALVTTDRELAERVRRLSFHGLTKARHPLVAGAAQPYDVIEPGYKYNMMDLQAALGIHQLERLSFFLQKRKELAAEYSKRLSDVPGVRPAPGADDDGHAWHLYCLVLDDQSQVARQRVIADLYESGIGVGIHFPAIHTLSFYKQFCPGGASDFPVADRVASNVMSLPLHTQMSVTDVERVVDRLAEAMRANFSS